MRTRNSAHSQDGFTLVEVLVAIAIMTIAFSSILMIQQGSIEGTLKAREAHIVAMLARNRMTESELELEGKAFNEVAKESAGEFKEPYKQYRWKREVREIKFPNITAGMTQASALMSGADSKTAENAKPNQMVEMMGRLVTKYLNDSIREVAITIVWDRGKGQREFTVSTYWVDLTKGMSLSE